MVPQGLRQLVLAAVVLLGGCAVEPADIDRPATLPRATEGPPTVPPVARPEGEKLYQLLYAGELGPQSSAVGQQARMLAWLSAMELSQSQLQGLSALLDRLEQARAAWEADQIEQDLREMTVLVPIYDRLIAAWTAGQEPSAAELEAFAAELAAARAALYGDQDPREASFRRLQHMMELCEPWVERLSESQRHTLSQSRFFLRRRLGPLLNPTDYGDLTGISWDGGDFRGINTTFRDDDEHHMDIGGLWSSERERAPPHRYLAELQHKALLLMALEEPGLREALAARLGEPARPAPADEGR